MEVVQSQAEIVNVPLAEAINKTSAETPKNDKYPEVRNQV